MSTKIREYWDARAREDTDSPAATTRDVYLRELEIATLTDVLRELGLREGVEWLLESVSEKHEIECRLGPDSKIRSRINMDLRTFAFRAIQELLTNIVKHAEASKVEVLVQEKDGKLVVVVSDNGRGFETSEDYLEVMGKSGFGLFSVRERSRYFGGGLSIETEPGRGTRVTITVPLKRRKASMKGK